MDIRYEIFRLKRQARRLEKQIAVCQAQIERCLAMLDGQAPGRSPGQGWEGPRSIPEGSTPEKRTII